MRIDITLHIYNLPIEKYEQLVKILHACRKIGNKLLLQSVNTETTKSIKLRTIVNAVMYVDFDPKQLHTFMTTNFKLTLNAPMTYRQGLSFTCPTFKSINLSFDVEYIPGYQPATFMRAMDMFIEGYNKRAKIYRKKGDFKDAQHNHAQAELTEHVKEIMQQYILLKTK